MNAVLSALAFTTSVISIVLLAAVLLSKRILSNPDSFLVNDEGWAFDVALALGLLLVVLLWISNIVPAGKLRLPLFLIAGASFLASMLLFGVEWRRVTFLILMVTAFATAIPVLLLDWLFYSGDYWLISGSNHDLMYFFGGSRWADIYPLRPSQETVESVLALGQCGGVLIGSGCPVYRDGGYALLSFATALLPDPSPNQVRSVTGIVSVFAVVGLLPALVGRKKWRIDLISWAWLAIAAVAVSCSAGFLGAYFNENIGTALGAALLVVIAGLALTSNGRYLARRAVAMGVLAGVSGLIYGEALAYACALVAIGVVEDAIKARKFSWIFSGGALSILSCSLVLSVAAKDLYGSFTAITDTVAQGKEWGSWYLGAPLYSWLGSPFSGMVMQGAPAVRMIGMYVGIILSLLTIALCMWRRAWAFVVGLIGLSMLLVYYIESSNYGYGEHKIIQLLGPIWVMALIVGLKDWYSSGWLGRLGATAAFLAAIGLSVDFIIRSDAVVRRNIVPESLRLDFADALAPIKSGDEVVLEVSSVFNGQRNVRADYATLLLHSRGARVRISNKVDRSWVGNTQRPIWDNFRNSSSPDWYLQFQPSLNSNLVIDRGPDALEIQTSDMKLYRLSDVQAPLVLAGRGWGQCGRRGCDVSSAYELEVLTGLGCKLPRVRIVQEVDPNVHNNAEGWQVLVDGLEVISPALSRVTELEFQVPAGYSGVQIRRVVDVDPQQAQATLLRVTSTCE